jgi:hypothetical protein
MAEISPAAQAMLAAYHKEAIDYIESWGSFSHKRGMASALRAVADRLDHSTSEHTLYAIAAELDGEDG